MQNLHGKKVRQSLYSETNSRNSGRKRKNKGARDRRRESLSSDGSSSPPRKRRDPELGRNPIKCSHCGNGHSRAECDILNRVKSLTDDERPPKLPKIESAPKSEIKENNQPEIVVKPQDKIAEYRKFQEAIRTKIEKKEVCKKASWHIPT